MYAIIDDSGQQFRVQEGDEIQVDCRHAEPGSTLTFDRVMLVAGGKKTQIGTPHVKGASVGAEVLGEAKGEKVDIATYKRRKKSRRHVGHRQKYLAVRIKEIKTG